MLILDRVRMRVRVCKGYISNITNSLSPLVKETFYPSFLDLSVRLFPYRGS